MAARRRLGVSPSHSRPASMVDLPGQLEAIFNEWPSRSYNDDDVPIVLGSDIPNVLLLWSQQYNNDIPLLDMDDDSVKAIFQTETIRTFQLTSEQVYRLVSGLLETLGTREPKNLDDAEVSMLLSTDDEDDLNVHLEPPTPSHVPLPASAGGGSASPDAPDLASDAAGDELFGAGAVMSTPAKPRSVSTHGKQLQQFQFPSPEKASGGATQASLARLRTTSNPETPPKRPKHGHKVYESRGDVPSAPSSWRHSKPPAPAKRRGSLSRSSSHESDVEDTFGSHRAPSNPASPRSAASVLSPGSIFQELDAFPMGRTHSLHASLSAPTRSGEFYHDPHNDQNLQEGDSMLELDMDSFHDMEATFASNPDAMPGDVSITRLYAYIRTCTRLMNQAIQKAQDAEAEMKKSERDRMVLSDDLDEARQQAAQMKREMENLLQQINTLNQSITASEINAANKEHELRRLHDKLHDRDRELQHSRTTIESLKHTAALKDDEIARLKESENELHSQLAEGEHATQMLRTKHSADLNDLKLKIQEAEERSMDLREEIKTLMHEKEMESNKLQTAEAELIALRAAQAESSKKTRLSSNKSPLANEFGRPEETDDGTLVDAEESTAESTDADNETFVTHTVVTRRKGRKSGMKAGPASVHTEIEKSRVFAEIAVQADPLQYTTNEWIQTDALPEPVVIDVQEEPGSESVQTVALPADIVDPAEPFPSTALLKTSGREATEAEMELERKVLVKWHGRITLPIEGLSKGISEDTVREWATLKQETGQGCKVIDQLLEQSHKTGPRPGSTKAVSVPAENASQLATKAHQIVRQVITKIYPYFTGEVGSSDSGRPLKSFPLTRNTLLWILLIISFYTFIILHWAAVLNPAAYYPGLTYRDRALWTSYHQYAHHRRYGPPRMARTSPISDPFTTAWYRMIDWATSG